MTVKTVNLIVIVPSQKRFLERGEEFSRKEPEFKAEENEI
jgi:hypothetical protein